METFRILNYFCVLFLRKTSYNCNFFLIFLQLGGFFSAEDADSLPSQTDTHKKEGAFCVWEENDIRKLLQEERATTKSGESIPVSYLFIKHYGVESEGNVKPHQVKTCLCFLSKTGVR